MAQSRTLLESRHVLLLFVIVVAAMCNPQARPRTRIPSIQPRRRCFSRKCMQLCSEEFSHSRASYIAVAIHKSTFYGAA